MKKAAPLNKQSSQSQGKNSREAIEIKDQAGKLIEIVTHNEILSSLPIVWQFFAERNEQAKCVKNIRLVLRRIGIPNYQINEILKNLRAHP